MARTETMSTSAEMAAPANIRVLVRVRPFSDREVRSSHLEIDDGGLTSAIDFGMGDTASTTSAADTAINGVMDKESKGTIHLIDHSVGSGGYGSGYDSGANNSTYALSASRSFTYDAVFGPQSKQVQIFDSIKGIVDAVCVGYNGTIVAYGQTGSGKTYTIFGDSDGPQDDDNAGLVQRSLKSIFDKIAEQNIISSSAANSSGVGGGASFRTTTTTKASFFEIYNERVYDLLSTNEHMTDDDKGLMVREDAMKGVYVEGLAEMEVSDTTEAMEVLRCGLDNRRVAATKMNRVSSRSHALFVLTVKSELVSENGISKVRMSKFTLVDLAGSERQKSTAAESDRLKEACNINNSLLCLGQVINALVDREKGKLNHVVFRNTNLTFLLRDSFGGNSKTCLVATVSPSHTSLTETVSTLKFAQRAKLIKNTAVLNENTCGGSVVDLQLEIARLRAELELKQSSIEQTRSGDEELNDRGLRPLAPKLTQDAEKPAKSIIVTALRNQNSMLTKKVEVLKDVSSQQEMQVNSLKRKVQQETLIRKCKERRITHLSCKGKTSGMKEEDEVAALREEVAILQEQVQAQPHDSIEWMLKYKVEKAKVEEMAANAAIFESNEKTEMEASLVLLLDERDSLQQKVEELSNQRNVEIDAIINDVTTLECSNVTLKSQLDEKELLIKDNKKKIECDAVHIEELNAEMKLLLDRLEMAQSELEAEMKKTLELQNSLDTIMTKVREANEAAAMHQGSMDVAKNQLAVTTKMHNDSLTALNNEISDLQTKLNDAMKENETLVKKLKEVSDDLHTKAIQLDNLEVARGEAIQMLEICRSKIDADNALFKLREEELLAEIEELKAWFDLMLVEKSQAFETINAQNASLLAKVEELKLKSDSVQHRITSSSDAAAELEDENFLVNIEYEQSLERQFFIEADLERTTRFQDHLRETQFSALNFELATNDKVINWLTREKSNMKKEILSVSQQLSGKTVEFDETITSLENDICALRENASILKAEQKEADILRKDHAQLVLHFENLTNDNNTFVATVAAITTERDDLQQSLGEKIAQLETDLSVAVGSKDTLNTRLTEVSDALNDKNKQIHALEAERNELAKQLMQHQEQHNAEADSFNLRELSMVEEITKATERNLSLLADKAAAAGDLEKATSYCSSLENELELVKAQMAALEEQSKAVLTLETEVARLTTEKNEVEQRLEASEAKLEHSIAALTTSHGNDEKIVTLTEEKAAVQKEVEDLARQLEEKERIMTEKIEMLMNEVAIMREERISKERHEKELQTQLSSSNEENASLSAQLTAAKDKISEFVSANEFSLKKCAKSQTECEKLNVELRSKTDRVDELEVLLENANALCKELSDKNASMSGDQKSPEEENVFEAANEQFIVMMPTSENPSGWESSPIIHNNPLLDSTFCADDTFDESLFLPNVQDEPKSPQTDENRSPPTPLTSNKRVLFSSTEDVANVKASGKTDTPVQRMTRSMRSKARTPLGESAVQNASSTTRKVRAKRQKS